MRVKFFSVLGLLLFAVIAEADTVTFFSGIGLTKCEAEPSSPYSECEMAAFAQSDLSFDLVPAGDGDYLTGTAFMKNDSEEFPVTFDLTLQKFPNGQYILHGTCLAAGVGSIGEFEVTINNARKDFDFQFNCNDTRVGSHIYKTDFFLLSEELR
jgi:hypothetical protein